MNYAGNVTADADIKASQLPVLRAAYSDRTAALMARLSGVAYEFEFDAPTTVLPVSLAELGFTSVRSFFDSDTEGAAYLAESRDLIVLAFRGTTTERTWFTDFTIDLVGPDGQGVDKRLRLHRGFLNAFEALARDGLEPAVEAIKERTQGQVPIYITGHSLGGALAQIAAARFGDDQVAACYTSGSPRVGNAYFDLWVKAPSYRIVNHADIVPQVPLPIVYRHSGDPRYLPERVEGSPFRYQPNLVVRFAQLTKGLFEAVRKLSLLQVADHAIKQYADKLGKIADARNQQR